MIDHQAAELVERIKQGMRQAMKDRTRTKLDALRSLLARISNAEAVVPEASMASTDGPIAGAEQGVGSTEMPRKQLTLVDVQAVIRAEMAELEVALSGLDQTSEYAAELREKAASIQTYLA